MPIGYALSSEEFDAGSLVRLARRAEDTGFSFALISDHFHPWTHHQGHSPFVWSVAGAIAQATDELRLGTGVTCPLIRIHPAVIAQAASTMSDLMPGRFFLGVGTGENLNEHITGERWPPPDVRADMLAEAIGVIRALWTGETVDHRGEHYVVEGARLYPSAPPPPIVVAAKGTRSAERNVELADGLVTTAPDPELADIFRSRLGDEAMRIGQVTVCVAPSDEQARKVAHEWWPNAAIEGQLGQELPMPDHFEQAAEMVTEEDVAEAVVCSADPQRHLDAIREFLDAGYDHVYVHQVGPEQDLFFDLYEREIIPELAPIGVA